MDPFIGTGTTAKRDYAWRTPFTKENQAASPGYNRVLLDRDQIKAELSATDSNHSMGDCTEGDAWQWSWFAPHDVPGLIELFGGKEPYAKKLNELFTTDSTLNLNDKPLTTAFIDYADIMSGAELIFEMGDQKTVFWKEK